MESKHVWFIGGIIVGAIVVPVVLSKVRKAA